MTYDALELKSSTVEVIGHEPDKQEEATKIVLEQAELLSAGWAEAQ